MRSKANATLVVTSVVGFGVVLMAGAMVLARTRGVPLGDLTYDTTSVFEAPVYVGSISRVTMMVWAAVGAQGVLVAVLVRSRRLPMGVFGTVSLFMAADDALRLHEGIGPRFGIPQEAFYVFYAAVAFALLVWFLRSWSSAGAAFLLGGALLAVSVVTDLFEEENLEVSDWLVLVEDGSKLLGALVWTVVPALVALEARRAAGARQV